ncbi:MAG: hypothetical protein SF052_13305 [Bacteroidia bacterium]|nr:hypothetical protein [Bacteroidia bacterium]
MKKLSIFFIFLLLVLALISGCRQEDAIRFPELEDGANVRIVIDPNASFFNFENLASAKLVYDVYSENKNIETVEIYAYFVPINGDPTIKKLFETYTQADFDAGSGKIHKEFSAQYMVDFFSLGSLDNLSGGDGFNFRNVTTLTNGRVFSDSTFLSDSPAFGVNRPGAIAQDIIQAAATTSFTCCFNTFVGCPSNLGGTYNVVTTATSTDGCCPDPVTVQYTTTLVQTGATTYTVKDFSAGTYTAWYCAPYGLCAGDFEGLGAAALDVCGTISLTAVYWGSAGAGSVDPATGVITIEWNNAFGDAGTSVYTPR